MVIPRFGLAHYEKRAIDRAKIFKPASVEHAGTSLRAHVLSISAQGALVHGSNPPVDGATVVLRIEGQRIWSKVVWVGKSYFGLRFLKALQAELVDRIAAPKPITPRT